MGRGLPGAPGILFPTESAFLCMVVSWAKSPLLPHITASTPQADAS